MSIFDIDVAALAASGIDVEMKDPLTGQVGLDALENPYVITVLGVDCPEWQNGVKAVQEAEDIERVTLENMMEHLPAIMARNTLGWSDNVELQGKVLDFNYDNALKLYKARPWVAQQLYSAALDKAQLRKKMQGP